MNWDKLVVELHGLKIYKKLNWLNELPLDEAEYVFRECCGSSEWAARMARSRPFPMLDHLFVRADEIWAKLSPADRLEAIAADDDIEAGAGAGTVPDFRKSLADAMSSYNSRFGFRFVLRAADKSADEILAICNSRLNNSPETELMIATDEQRKITEDRLGKLLER